MKEAIAHSNGHTWLEHTVGVAKLASEFGSVFDSGIIAGHAACLHDFGKLHPDVQQYLEACASEEKATSKPHAPIGAALAMQLKDRYGPEVARTMAHIIAGHHAGLHDRLGLDSAVHDGSKALGEISQEQLDQAISMLQGQITIPGWVNWKSYHFWVRMVYSCIVDADFLDTEASMNPQKSTVRSQSSYLPVEDLRDKLDDYLKKLIDASKPTHLNAIRSEILSACRRAAPRSRGLYSLTAPTGGSKTLSSLAFGLSHAAHHGMKRIIYVAPYTSIVSQTAVEFAKVFGRGQVVEHHSNIELQEEPQRLSSENWDAPIIVTTDVQFFESLYANRPSRCRKLHNMANSVVILDEIQLLPPDLLAPCINAINALARDYGITFVLTTATQPGLTNLRPPLPFLDSMQEIIADLPTVYRSMKRVEYHLPDTWTPTSWDQVATKLQEHPSIMCIVNSRRDCRTLWELMPPGTIHLSRAMCGTHCASVIKRIRRMLERGEPVRVISTQLIECGVNLDFPVLYRAMTGLANIVQAAGRCNREWLLEMGHVHVFVPPKPSRIDMLRKSEDTSRELISIGVDMHDPDTYRKYYGLFYGKCNHDQVVKQYRNWLERDCPRVDFETAAMNFRFIKDDYQPVIVHYGSSHRWVDQLLRSGPKRDIMRALQRYTVSIPRSAAQRLESMEGIAMIGDTDVMGQGCIAYSNEFGLDYFVDLAPNEGCVG